MPTTDENLSPGERFREIASILAAGILRLRTRADSVASCPESSANNSPKYCRKSLDEDAPRLPDVTAG